MYQEVFSQLSKKPYHLSFTTKLIDVSMLTDLVGPIPEARHCLQLVDCQVLPSNVHIPEGFANRSRSMFMPYKFLPGPGVGYYLVKMSGEGATFTAEPRKEEFGNLYDEDIDLGNDDFEETAGPSLSIFDTDMQTQSEAAKDTQAKTKTVQKQPASKKSTTESESSRSKAPSPKVVKETQAKIKAVQQQPASQRLTTEGESSGAASARSKAASAKAVDKQPAVPTGKQRESSQAAPTKKAGSTATISASSEANYVGLLSSSEQPKPSAEKPKTLLARLSDRASSADYTKVNAEPAIEYEKHDDSEERTDDEQTVGLKRVRTTDTQSTTSTACNTKEKSKTTVLLKQFQQKYGKK